METNMTKGLGMMWQILPVKSKKNGDPVYPSLKDAIAQASQHFHAKHGVEPTLIQCNPTQLAGAGLESAEVQPNPMVPATHLHLWGVPDER